MATRRDFLKMAGAGAGGMLLGGRAGAQEAADPRFLIVLGAGGGGSIIDGPLAIRASESANPDTINTFADSMVTGFDGSPFRAVDLAGTDIGPIPSGFDVTASQFFARRRQEMMVVTSTGTSVNHTVAQRRSVTGNEAWRGRTLQEAVATQYGADAPIPNVHLLAGFGFNEFGTDTSVPSWARGQIVANPAVWPLSLDASKGQRDGLDPDVLAAVRKHRNEVFDATGRFGQLYGNAPRIVEWNELRGTPQQRIEDYDLITKLMFPPDSERYPLSTYGLSSSPASEMVRAVFPKFEIDPLQAQAAMAFLLLKYRVSVSVTLGPSFDFIYDPGDGGEFLPTNSVINPPLAFDFSHQAHRAGQAIVWNRIYGVIDGLISLLSAEDFGDGTSFWDRTLIYVATEFGREKIRPSGATDWGTGHHLNNGFMVFSPLVPGDTLLGGVNPDTGLTYGFDTSTGEPDPGVEMPEATVFSGLLGALGVDTSGSGLPDVPAMRV